MSQASRLEYKALYSYEGSGVATGVLVKYCSELASDVEGSRDSYNKINTTEPASE